MTPFKLVNAIPTEHDECVCLLQWAHVKRHKGYRISDYLVMVPNGARLFGDIRQRAMQMAKMKAEGLKNGCFDYILALPVDPYPGLWLEMKRSKLGVVSEAQKRFKSAMEDVGWLCVICAGWDQAKTAIEHYLGSSAESVTKS